MGQVPSRVLCTEVGIREGDKNLQKTHRIQETVAGIPSVLEGKAILCTCQEQRPLILFPAPPVPSAQLPPIPSGHQPAQRQQALTATILNY